MIKTRDNPPALLTKASTWITVFMLTYFCMLGTSPFLHNTNIQWRMANSTGDDSLAEHVFTYVMCFTSVCLFLKSPRRVWRRFSSIPWLAACPFMAVMSALWSETPAQTIRAGVILLCTTVWAAYFSEKYTYREQMVLLFTAGAIVISASLAFGAALPQYGLDHLGGHDDAWKGIFPAKNTCGAIVLLLLIPALYITPRRRQLLLRSVYVLMALTLLLLSRCVAAWIGLGVLAAYFVMSINLTRFRTKDMLAMGGLLAIGVMAIAAYVYSNFTHLMYMVGKDPSMNGRAEIWSAVFASIFKHPVLGYGYSAFWRGLEGESANTSMRLGVIYGQSQNGFLDVWLQLGAVGLFSVVMFIVGACRDLFRSVRYRHTPAYQGYLALLCLFMLYNLGESGILNAKHISWILLVSSCFSLRAMSRQSEASPLVQDTSQGLTYVGAYQ
jgi:exopolysaccharide production protein ExoQ